MIQHWEAANQLDLTRLGGLIEKIIHVAKSFGGKATIEYDSMRAKLVFRENTDLDKMLPDDLYARWGDGDASREELVGDSRVNCRQGDDETGQGPNRSEENALIEMGMGESVVRDGLPFAAVIRSAVAKGFRQFFRNMPTSLGDYHTLCDSLRASNVDVLQGRQVRDLMADLRSGKEDWDTEGHYKISGSKNVARDSAFRLLYIFLQEKTEDSNAAYNATLFVVSHYRIFKYKTRKMVRQAFNSTYTPSVKQKKELDKWSAEGDLQEDDVTTEEEEEVSCSDYYDSDYS
ncbi:hypothetical protein ColLi_13292 [Colletotrichum liriopes]|uniref:Uncharacterized protein n=1 Tax=Colletotrichum liriopes TaxID=708192 RepID=A0AA37H0T9_9PEZI|nr:hypothetical protein ColLi_13292 [Colletotrichum liriopes]